MFNAYHFNIETTFDTTDSVAKTFFIILTKKDIYRSKSVVTLLQMFPNLFPCVYIIISEMMTLSLCYNYMYEIGHYFRENQHSV